jgi:hypothetical protein
MNKELIKKLKAKGNTVYKGNFWKGFKPVGKYGAGLRICNTCDKMSVFSCEFKDCNKCRGGE